jgi:hypothetical protein
MGEVFSKSHSERTVAAEAVNHESAGLHRGLVIRHQVHQQIVRAVKIEHDKDGVLIVRVAFQILWQSLLDVWRAALAGQAERDSWVVHVL